MAQYKKTWGEKAQAAPLQAINLESHQNQQQLICWRTSLLAPNFLLSIIIKPLVPSPLYTKTTNPSFIMMCYILNFSWLPTSHSKGQLFSITQTKPVSRSLSSQKTANICTHISNNLRTIEKQSVFNLKSIHIAKHFQHRGKLLHVSIWLKVHLFLPGLFHKLSPLENTDK